MNRNHEILMVAALMLSRPSPDGTFSGGQWREKSRLAESPFAYARKFVIDLGWVEKVAGDRYADFGLTELGRAQAKECKRLLARDLQELRAARVAA